MQWLRGVRVSWTLLAILFICSVLFGGAFEYFRPRALTYDGLWQARTAVWGTILVFWNLVFLWWYSSTMSETAEYARTQATAAMEQLKDAREAENVASRPLVVTGTRRLKPQMPGERLRRSSIYVMQNVGAGIALNVYYVGHLTGAGHGTLANVGSVAADGEARLPARIEDALTDPPHAVPHVLIAEAAKGDVRWIITLNVLLPNGELHHRMFKGEVAEGTTITDFLYRNRGVLARQLDEFTTECTTQLDGFMGA